MTSIKPCTFTETKNHCTDITKPQKPELIRAFAFIKEDAVHGYAQASVKRDPIYILLGDMEPNSKISFINRSKKPDATWSDETVFELTGYDTEQRRGALTLSNEQMQEYDLQPGDELELCAIDKSGLRSDSIRVRVNTDLGSKNHNGKATFEKEYAADFGYLPGFDTTSVQSKNSLWFLGNNGRTSVIVSSFLHRFLDGLNTYKDMPISTQKVQDTRKPFLAQKPKYTPESGELDFRGGIETTAEISVRNLSSKYGDVKAENHKLAFKGMCGDILEVMLKDNQGVESDPIFYQVADDQLLEVDINAFGSDVFSD